MSAPRVFPIELTVSRGFRRTAIACSLAGAGVAAFFAIHAAGLLGPVGVGMRVFGVVAGLFMVACAVFVHGGRLTLHDNRIEEVSFFGLRRVVIPIPWTHGFRARAGMCFFFGPNDERIGTISLTYEQPELLLDYLSQRLVWLAERDALGAAAPQQWGNRLIAAAGVFTASFLYLGVPAPIFSTAAYAFAVAAIVARYRYRRLALQREVMEPLRAAQLLSIPLAFMFTTRAIPALSVWPRAALVCVAAALLYLAFERRIDRSRGLLASFGFALIFMAPLVLDLNARFSPAPTVLRADVTSTCCACNKPWVAWHNLERGYSGTLNVTIKACPEYANGGQLAVGEYRGAFYIPFVSLVHR